MGIDAIAIAQASRRLCSFALDTASNKKLVPHRALPVVPAISGHGQVFGQETTGVAVCHGSIGRKLAKEGIGL